MKKTFKKLIAFLLFSIPLLFNFIFPVYADADYTIDGYDVNIVVNENNTYIITETIVTNFNLPKHGIIRKIPLKNEVERLDGSRTYNRVRITDISVNADCSVSTEGNFRVLKIGSPDYTVTGKQTYIIKYNYNIGKDTLKDNDEFYFNVIGTDWDTTISNVTFTVEMPKPFDSTKLGFSKGEYGTADSSDIEFQVNGNTITGSYNGTLYPKEALTARLELEEGYFVNASTNFDFFSLLAIILPICFALISFFLWNKYGKDNAVVETVEFYPPEGLNSAETALYYKGKAENKDAVSLLIYLANKGYLKIVETGKKSDFKIIKLRDYDGDNQNERLFFEGLFKHAESVDGNEEVTPKNLENKFYTTLHTIIFNLNGSENKKKIFEKSSLSKRAFVILMIAVSFLLITVKPLLNYGDTDLIFFAIIFPGISFTLAFFFLFGSEPLVVRILGFLIGGFIGILTWFIFMYSALDYDRLYMGIYFLGLACIAFMCFMFSIMPKRTRYGNEILGKIRGFKNFLELVEKPKLEELVMQDPSYFYNILPFTYVLGISDKWIKKFETISINRPDWYESNTEFNVFRFGYFINSTMSNANSAMVSRPQEKSSGGDFSGGGFTGGGFSGGGSGGGGGSSW